MRRLQASRTLVVFYCLLVPLCSAGWSDRPAPEEPKLAAASDECERALRAVQAKGGLQGELYAAELGIAEAGDVLRKYVLRRDLDGKQRAAALVPLAGRVPPDAKLDLVLAARKRETPQLEAKLGQYDAAKPKDDTAKRSPAETRNVVGKSSSRARTSPAFAVTRLGTVAAR